MTCIVAEVGADVAALGVGSLPESFGTAGIMDAVTVFTALSGRVVKSTSCCRVKEPGCIVDPAATEGRKVGGYSGPVEDDSSVGKR